MPPRDTPKDQGALLTIRQAADRAGVSIDTIRRWANQGLLPCLRTPGKQRRFRADDIDAIYQAEPTPIVATEAAS
jgi:excisionase family DNA binding protein